jgi:ubiquinone biosynthesis protein COQ9
VNAYTPAQSNILSAALLHVPKHGFTAQSLTLGVREAGYLDVSLQLFPRGGEIELVLFWLGSRRSLLREKVEKGEMFPKRNEGGGEIRGKEFDMEDKVKMLILERLQMNEKVIHQWQDVSFRVLYLACFLALDSP